MTQSTNSSKMNKMDRQLKEPLVSSMQAPFSWRVFALELLQPIAAILLGVALSLIAVKLLGDSPLLVLKTLVKSAVGTREDLGMTLFYATPLIFTGLSVAIAFQAGLFNIGAEGQLMWGAMAAAIAGIVGKNIPGLIAPIVGGLAAMVAGGIWGFIPGWLRARRGFPRSDQYDHAEFYRDRDHELLHALSIQNRGKPDSRNGDDRASVLVHAMDLVW